MRRMRPESFYRPRTHRSVYDDIWDRPSSEQQQQKRQQLFIAMNK